MPKRKAFVDKKKSVAFRLVHRSQKDPLIVADGGDLVYVPIESGVEKLKLEETENAAASSSGDVYRRREEQAKFGVFYDDDYNYLQHLKDANEVFSLEPVQERFRIEQDGRAVDAGKDIYPSTSSIKLPSSLFESRDVELKVGLLNQAAPQSGPHPELDPDIVAALDDDDFDFNDPENQLEDDFILKANAPGADSSSEVDLVEHRARPKFDSDDDDDSSSLSEDEDDVDEFEEEETKSRFTNYSLTSSVMHRTDGLQKVDAMFEKLYEQYDEEELGDLEPAESNIVGFLAPDGVRMRQMVEEYEEKRRKDEKMSDVVLNEKEEYHKKNVVIDEDDEEELEKVFVEEPPKERWDCESVLSTYSNLYNHPTLITEPPKKKRIQINSKTGLPEGVFFGGSLGPVLKQLDGDNPARKVDVGRRSNRSKASTVRNRQETPEERKLRKETVRLERKERRVEKKANKLAFKDEEKRQNLVQLNLRQNLSGVKLL